MAPQDASLSSFEDENSPLTSHSFEDGGIDAEPHSRRQVPEEIGLLGQPSAHLIGMVDESQKSNIRMAFMNMANSIIGAGVICQPYAVKQAGLIGGILLLIGLTVAIDWTIRLMVTNSKLSGMKTYQSTVRHCFGATGALIVSLAQGAFAFGGSMAYCIIIGDTMPHVLRAVIPHTDSNGLLRLITSRSVSIFFFVFFVSYPLALNRNIGALAKASALALVSMVIITLTVIIRGSAVRPEEGVHMTLPLWTFNSGIFQAVSIISFAFVCHHNTLLIYDSLKTPTLNRFASVVHWSTGVSMVSCTMLGLGGFLSFQDHTLGNILNNFPSGDVMTNIARFCFGFNMVTTLPLEIFVCREVILEYMFPQQENSTTKQHAITTSMLMLVAMAVSLFTCDLGIILELVGASSACSMAFILPPMCYLKLSSKPLKSLPKIASWVCISFGAMVTIMSTVMTLLNLGKGTDQKCDFS